ncbi:MAG: GHKL domain-containing protein [Lachnospiraceae bacterium]|nr:GHKL domain-containing protein [Lachnospiraceae bacterium]
MIKNLQIKFTIIAMCSMFLVLATIMTGLNIANYAGITKDANRLLNMIASNDGTFPEPPKDHEHKEDKTPPAKPEEKDSTKTENKPDPTDAPHEPKQDIPPHESEELKGITEEAPYSTRFFTVWLDEKGEVTSTHLDKIAAITETDAKTYAKEIYSSKRETGLKDSYRYKRVATDTGCMIIFLDRRSELNTFKNNLLTSITASLAGLLAVFILVTIFSRIVFRPVEESYQKQKRFITDASHEIKTPLTIIDANIEVIEMLHEESEWTKSIRNQVKRLSSLTKHLVMLSKLEEKSEVMEKEPFSLSELVEESVQSFSALALTGDKKLETAIEENIEYTGDEKAISQLTGLLIDNAIKYSTPESVIRISLKKQKRKIRLEVWNEAEKLPKGNLDVLFERFYRMDSSRNSKTGGSGIGLSVAHAIVESHKGQITANSADGKSLSIVVKL